MAKQTSLSVDEIPIDLDYFVADYLEHVIGGIIGSLHDTGEIDTLELNIDNEGRVTINLNNADVPLKYFPVEIIRSTILGMIAPLKGVEGAADRVEITIKG